MKFTNSFLGLLLAAGLVSGSMNAQDESAEDAGTPTKLDSILEKAYLGTGLGLSTSFSDIKQYPIGLPVMNYRVEYGFGLASVVGYKFNSIISAEGGLGWHRLNGTKRSELVWFTASVWQWDLGGRLNLINIFKPATADTRKLDAYSTFGLGLSAFRSRQHALNFGESTDAVLDVEGYEAISNPFAGKDGLEKKRRTIELSAYLGLALSYRYNDKIDFISETRAYFLNSDKLDTRVSTGNNTKDKYVYTNVGVIYHWGGAADVRSKPEGSPEAILEDLQNKFQDSDNDGVFDINDKDNNTPAGVKVYPDGTAIDTDGDGVADYKDTEIVSPCKEVDESGKAKDSDNDGVVDCNDVEPNTASGAQVDGKGKTIQTSVGVAPAVAPAANGSEASAQTSAGRISGLPPVFFSSNSSSVSYKNYTALTQVAQFLVANPTAKLIIVGNSDRVGGAEYNKVLAQKRAQSVVDHLVKNNGVDASRLTIQSNGSEKPISTKRNSGQDRRVDFLLQ